MLKKSQSIGQMSKKCYNRIDPPAYRGLERCDKMALMEVTFPGGKKVDATIRGYTVRTDQPERAGGEGSAPTPFNLFLSSLGTCAGIYALGFCESKGISTEGLKLTMDIEKNPETKMISKITMNLSLPEGFPEKYEKAIIRSMNLCAVKQHMFQPPEFEITTEK